MNDVILQIRVPQPLLDLGLDYDDVQQRVQEWLVLSLFTDERISSGKAARLLEMTRLDFLTLLRKQGIAYLDFSPNEWAEEAETARLLSPASAAVP